LWWTKTIGIKPEYNKMFCVKAARLQIESYFHEKFENVIKNIILYINQKEAIYTLSMTLKTHVNYKKRSKYAKIALTALVTQ
jgi:hypothetical protein